MQLVIDLPSRQEQIAFNRRRWEEVCTDRSLADLPGRVETNAHGSLIMMPPPSGNHSSRQGEAAFLLRSLLGGKALPECPVSTIDGVRAADVGWYSEKRYAAVKGQLAFEIAPEICVEVISPGNSSWEMRSKRKLYFEAGAEEVWLCAENGEMSFYQRSAPDLPLDRSTLCPDFPASI
jgi:Uma2 family endonuclease